MSTDVRRCWACEQTLPITAFSHNYSGNDHKHQRRYICRTCNTRKRDAWLASLTPEQREHYRAQQRRRHKRSPAMRERAETSRKTRKESIETLLVMIRRLREWGYSRERIAREAGMSASTLWLWEQRSDRRCVKRETVEKVSRVYLAALDRMHDEP